jgi:hypothetical protein
MSNKQQGFEELLEIMRYLTQTPQGQQQAEKIAAAGRIWLEKNLREVDAVAYMFWLLLEYTRLFK